jgi:hypothetical protein
MASLRFLEVLLLIGGGFIRFACLLGAQGSETAASASHLDTSLRLDSAVRLLDGSNRRLTLKSLTTGRWSVVIDSAEPVEPSALVFPLALVKRFQAQGLRYVLVLPGPTTAFSAPSNTNVVVVVSRVRISNAPSQEPAAQRTYLISPTGKILFSASNLRNDLLKQICERELLGQIDYSHTLQTPLLVAGASPPPVIVRSLNGAKSPIASLAVPGVTILFFRSNCSRCGVSRELGIIADLKRNGILEKARAVVVLSSSYWTAGMKDELLSAKLSGEAWIADEEVTGWEDIYHSVAFELDNVPVAITFGQGGCRRAS